MWNKIIKLFIYLGINILFFLQLFLLSIFLTSPLVSVTMLVLNSLCKSKIYILIWVALSTVLAIMLCVRVLWKVRKMNGK